MMFHGLKYQVSDEIVSALQTTANLVQLLERAVANFDIATTFAMIDLNLHSSDIGQQLFKRFSVSIFLDGHTLARLRLGTVACLRQGLNLTH